MKALSQEEKRRKLRELARGGGHASVVEMLKACVTDSVSPAICTAPDCSYTTEMEPIKIAATARRAAAIPSSRLSCSPASFEEAGHVVLQLLPVRHMRPRMD